MSVAQCFMPTCDRKRDPRWAICNACFQMLPTLQRFAITRAYSPSMVDDETSSVGLKRAINDAQSWVIATFGQESGATRASYTPEKWERLKETVRARDAARAERKLQLENDARAAAGKAPRPGHLKLVP